MHRYLGILAAAMLVACGGSDKDDAPAGDDDDDDSACENEIISTFPAAGESGVYYRTAVEFTLDTASGDETITVSAGGDAVAGTTSVDGKRVIWTPSAPLSPSTSYDVSLDWECGPTTIDWTTSDVGAEVDETNLEGYAYALDLSSGRFVKPAGVGAILEQFLTQEILIGVTAADASSIEMMGALGTDAGQQDLCTPTIEFPVAADFVENPYFSVVSDVLELNIQGIDIRIDDLVISGAFAPDLGSIEGAVLSGAIDVRDLSDLLDMSADEACELVLSIAGVACEPCSDNADYCLSVHVDSMTALRANGVTLVTRTDDDISADPACTTAR